MDTYETNKELDWTDLYNTVRKGTCADIHKWKAQLLKRLSSCTHHHEFYGGAPVWGTSEGSRIVRSLKLLGLTDREIHEGAVKLLKRQC